MLASVTYINAISTFRRQRTLPILGKVLTRMGQDVGSKDVIAEANLAPEHLILDISLGLGIPEGKVPMYLEYKLGDDVSEGDILAGPVGIAKRVVRTPRSGQIISIFEGKILIECKSTLYSLRAGVPGVVVEIIENRGVVIETTGSLIQGVWGNGRIDFGPMEVIIGSPDDIVSPDQFEMGHRGLIILAGHCNETEVFTAALEVPVRGMILSSMTSNLVPLALKMPFPIVITEGFGRISMNSMAYQLLIKSNNKDVSISGEMLDRFTGTRPEIFIPLPENEKLPDKENKFVLKMGQKIRINRAPYNSKIGTLLEIRPGLTTFPNNVRAVGVNVQLEDERIEIVPMANIEVLA